MTSKNSAEQLPPHIVAAANRVLDNALPEKSKDRYVHTYGTFLEWQKKQGTTSFAEEVLVAYFDELSKKLKPSTLWSVWSMLKTTIDNKKGIDISKYTQLHRFVKRQNVGFTSKKSKVLTSDDVKKFLREAPDYEYLATKVALIVGVYGACRGGELCDLTISNIIDKNTVLHVNIPDTKTHLPRTFVIDGEYYDTVKKYMNLRPQKAPGERFFLNYQSGKCTRQPIGKNKLSNMPAQIATYLNLPDPKSYTGHSFRRTSATILADAGADMISIKRHGGWKSDRVAEGYIDDSVNNKKKRSNQLTEFINAATSTMKTSTDIPSPKKKKEELEQVNVGGNTSKPIVSVDNKENSTPQIVNYHFHINSVQSFTLNEKNNS